MYLLYFNFAHSRNCLCTGTMLFLNWYKVIDPVQNLLNGSRYTFLRNSLSLQISRVRVWGFHFTDKG